jgi:phosphoglycolate phosphatase-like HAD superfamily hydrolase
MRRLILFDIDGTLLLSASAGRHAIQAAFAEEFADLAFFDQVRFDGKTDPQIVGELYAAAGVPERGTPERTQAILDRYLGYLEREVASRADRVRPLPGIVPLLDALAERPAALVGLLTGNIVRGAALKLGAAGLALERFSLGAYGSDSAHRPDLPPIAAQRAEAHFGRVPTGAEVVILGDTPADVTCGQSIGARAIGVATGAYSRDELLAAGAYAAFDTFADTEAVLETIF